MSTIKTRANDASVEEFIEALPNETRRKDSLELLRLFARVTGETPRMWGASIVGYGRYHYKSERSRQEGDWPMTGFSPGKQNLSLYVLTGFVDNHDLLEKLGKHKTGVSCLYINKLADVDLAVLEQIIARSYEAMKAKYP